MLTYEDIKVLNWFIADQVRDKGNGNNNDAMSVAIPILIFKRLLDMRKEYIAKFFNPDFPEQYNVYSLYGDLDQTIANYQNNAPTFAVKQESLSLYRLEWKDIIEFPDNHEIDEALEYKDGCGGFYKTKAKNKVELIQEIIDSFNNSKISEIFNYLDFKTKINSNNISQILSYNDFVELLKEMDKYDLSLANAPSDVFSEAYMDLLQRFAPQKGSKQGEFFTPNKITKAGIRMINPNLSNDGLTVVADITSGACTFMTEFAEFIINKEKETLNKTNLTTAERNAVTDRMQIVVQEKDRVSYAAGEANLLLHGCLDRTIAFHGNTITEYTNKIGMYENKCDYIFANPPYGLDDYGLEHAKTAKENGVELARWEYGVPNATDGEFAFLQTIVGLLSDKGRALVVLPLGTLFRDSTSAQRQIFIEQKDYVEGIVLLPGKLFNTTDIPVCFWIINKNKSENEKGKIFFINAENDFTKMKNKNDWNIEKAVEYFLSKKEEEGYSKYIDNSIICSNKYDLSVGKYVRKEEEREVIIITNVLEKIDRINNKIKEEKLSMETYFQQIRKIYEE